MTRAQNPGAADRFLGAMKQNPEALLLLAAGAAMLMRSTPAKPAARRSSETDADAGIAQAAEGVRQYTADAAGQVRDAAASYASTASDYAGKTGRAIGEQFEQTQSVMQGTFDRVLRDQPLMVAVAGLAAGAALAASFPPTDLERETLGPVGERVSAAAAEVGGRVKDAASEASDALKQSAERRGMTVDGLKEMASEARDAFSDRMSGNSERGGNPGSQDTGTTTAGSRRTPLD
jgi:hypothetical protein